MDNKVSGNLGGWRDVALTGYSRVGKDVIGVATLVGTGKYIRVAFGDHIKREMDLCIKSHFGFSAFTDDTEEKKVIRALLECWGDTRYYIILNKLISEVQQIHEGGLLAVNARICRVEEANEWVENGGVIIEMRREGVNPSTDWERDRVQEIRDAGLVTSVFEMGGGGIQSDRVRFLNLMREMFGHE